LFKITDWGQFEKLKQDLNKTQELIDFEKFLSLDGKWYYLGVWRQGKPSGVLHRTLIRGDLFARWGAFKSDLTLLDVEEYTPLPARINGSGSLLGF
jgi:hypothetical protein